MIVVFSLSALWWRRIRGLWELPDGRDWLRGKLGLVLMSGAMLSKSLIQFSVDGWAVVPHVISVQFSSVAQSSLTLCDPVNRSTPGLPVLYHLLEIAQTHVHRVGDVIIPHFLSLNLWAMPCRATQDGWVMVESSDKMWSTAEGNGKPLQYSCLENTKNSMKRKNIGHWKMSSPAGEMPNMPMEISGEITPERMKQWNQSKNNTQ